MRHAVIGIGSNSTRLLVGDVQNGEMQPIQRLREGTRLFEGLEEGRLTEQSMMRAADAVARFASAAREAGSSSLHVMATCAARDAQNGGEFAALIEDITGVTLEIISGIEEARLSFLGATDGQKAGMVDIGGGSTELATGWNGMPRWSGSAQLGAVRLFGEVAVLLGDGFERALAAARERASGCWMTRTGQDMPQHWYGVGGTITCLASMDMHLAAFDRAVVDGHILGIGTVENWARRLAKLSIEERAALPGIHPQRADIIAHGAIVLLGVMQALELSRIAVSNRTNLDGYLMDLAKKEA